MYEFDWSSIPGALPLLTKGLSVTLEITLTAIVVGIVWGTLLAVARLGSNRWLWPWRLPAMSTCSAPPPW